MKESNEALVSRYQSGQATFEEVYLQCKAMIHNEARRWRIKGMDYEDKVSVLMEAFLEACHRYDEQKGVKFSTFCITHLRYRIRDHWRKATQLSSSKYQVLSAEGALSFKDQTIYETGLIEASVHPHQAYLDQELEQLVLKILSEIKEPARSYTYHFLFKGMTKIEIANQYGLRSQNVQYHIRRALEEIQRQLIKKEYI